jgi:hypothetical protein
MATLIPASSPDLFALQIEQPLHCSEISCCLALELPEGRGEDSTIPPFRLRRASFKGRGLQPELRAAAWDRLRDLA